MTPVTQLLEAANRGDRQAAAELLPIVYGELRKLAAAKMAGEAVGHTLDATALVHEAWLKLVGESYPSRIEFFRAAAVAMRRILVDHAGRKTRSNAGLGIVSTSMSATSHNPTTKLTWKFSMKPSLVWPTSNL